MLLIPQPPQCFSTEQSLKTEKEEEEEEEKNKKRK
jgi:hypothetical protein